MTATRSIFKLKNIVSANQFCKFKTIFLCLLFVVVTDCKMLAKCIFQAVLALTQKEMAGQLTFFFFFERAKLRLVFLLWLQARGCVCWCVYYCKSKQRRNKVELTKLNYKKSVKRETHSENNNF